MNSSVNSVRDILAPAKTEFECRGADRRRVCAQNHHAVGGKEAHSLLFIGLRLLVEWELSCSAALSAG